jgi:hypothetical protein
MLALVASLAVASQPQRVSAEPVLSRSTTSHSVSSGKHGSGYSFPAPNGSKQWIGSWKIKEGSGFCIQFNLGHPQDTGAHKVHKVPGMGPKTSARAMYITNAYATTKNDREGAAAAIAVWKLQNTSRFNSYYKWLDKHHKVSASLKKRVAQILNESYAHGPYKLSVKQSAGLVGQVITGTVTARAVHNHAAAGKLVSLSLSNAHRISGPSRTGSKGVSKFKARVTDIGTVTSRVTLTAPSSKTVWLTSATPGHQKLIVAGPFHEKTHATASSQKTVGGVSLTSNCNTNCNGEATVRATTPVIPAGAKSVKYTLRVGSKAVATLIASAGHSATATTPKLRDTTHVTTEYCYVDSHGKCVTKTVHFKGSFEVVCPPSATANLIINCSCSPVRQVRVSAMPSPENKRYDTLTLRVGSSSRTVALTNGKSTTVGPLAVKRGDNVSCVYHAYRDADHKHLLRSGELCGVTVTH